MTDLAMPLIAARDIGERVADLLTTEDWPRTVWSNCMAAATIHSQKQPNSSAGLSVETSPIRQHLLRMPAPAWLKAACR